MYKQYLSLLTAVDIMDRHLQQEQVFQFLTNIQFKIGEMQRLEKLSTSVSESSEVYDYVVIGAGISGIQIAEILTQQTSKIVILEAQNIEGGRVISESVAELPGALNLSWIRQNLAKFKDVMVEKGATWIEQRHTAIKAVCKSFGLELREQVSEGVNLYLDNQKSYTSQQLMQHPTYGPNIKFTLERLDYLANLYNQKVLKPSCSGKEDAKLLIEFDKKTVMEFLQQNVHDAKTRELFQNFLQHTECISCEENSMHEVLTKHARSNDVGILKEFIQIYEHEGCFLVNGGTSALIEKYLEKITMNIKRDASELFIYDSQVITIDNKKPDVCIVVACNTRNNTVTRYRAKKIICTVPLSVTRTISFTNISPAKRYIFDNQLRTTASKSFLVVKKPFWRKFACGDGLFSYDHIVNMCHDISPPDLSCGIMVYFHMGKKLIDWDSMFRGQSNEHEARRQYIIDLTCKLFRVTDPKQKEQYFSEALFYESTFMDNPYIRSGFQSNTRPGTFRNILRMRDGLDSFYRDQNNVYFVGSEYSKQFASYMEGAIRVARLKGYKLIGQKDPLLAQSQ